MDECVAVGGGGGTAWFKVGFIHKKRVVGWESLMAALHLVSAAGWESEKIGDDHFQLGRAAVKESLRWSLGA